MGLVDFGFSLVPPLIVSVTYVSLIKLADKNFLMRKDFIFGLCLKKVSVHNDG